MNRKRFIVQMPESLRRMLPWLGIRPIEGTNMVEVDVYWFYWMSMTTYSLHTFPREGVPLGAISGYLGMARVALENFGDERARAFPKTGEAINEILEWINRIMPERDAASPLTEARMNTFVGPAEMATLSNKLSSLITFLKDESNHGYVVSVENQRLLSAYSLIENIESCFPVDLWSVIEREAKREFEESGKCLAFERYTAAAFHALRGVECVIRQYIVKLTGSLPQKRDWGHYIQVLKDNNADLPLLAVLDNIRTLDRNPLMHPENWLDVDEAIAVFMISQTAIVRLAVGIKK
jgi:hypothetical protein